MTKETASPRRGERTTVSDHRTRLMCSALGPAALAVGYFKTHDMTKATEWMVGGALLGLVIGFRRFHRVQWLPLILAAIGMIVAVLSIAFPAADILRLKTTVVEASLGLLLIGASLMGKNPLANVFGTHLALPDDAWRKLAWHFAVFCILVAVVNEIIRQTQANSVWVLFHFPGLLILHALFVAVHLPWLMRQRRFIAGNAKGVS